MPEHDLYLSTGALSFGISSTKPRTDRIVDATAPRKKSGMNDLKKRGGSSQGLSPFLLDLLLDPYSITGLPSASIDSLYLRTLKPIAILLFFKASRFSISDSYASQDRPSKG